MVDQQKRRSWFKCSACRNRKVSCKPHNRNWELNKEKCELCKEHGWECGPNYRKKDDPGPRSVRPIPPVDLLQQHSSPNARQPSLVANLNIPGRTERLHNRQPSASSTTPSTHIPSTIQPVLLTEHNAQFSLGEGTGYDGEKNGIPSLTNEELEGKSDHKLQRFHELGKVYSYYITQLAVPSIYEYNCTDQYRELNGECTAIKEKLHTLFIFLFDLGQEANKRSQKHLAKIVFLRLVYALENYAGLFDPRKRIALLKIALFFQESNYLFDAEHVLSRLAEIKFSLISGYEETCCRSLAESLPVTSRLIGKTLAGFWEKMNGLGNVPPTSNLPPFQRAVLHPNCAVATAGFANSLFNSIHVPDVLGRQALHVAAEQGSLEHAQKCIDLSADLHARDVFGRTPLFLAAMHGWEAVCALLLKSGASVLIRDINLNTILQVAAKGGHLCTVQRLTEHNAPVDDPPGVLGSTALQAAVESNNEELVFYLMIRANVDTIRFRDQKTAIDLAEERGMTRMAQLMRERSSEQYYLQQNPLDMQFYGDMQGPTM